jgi:hypothetical protein
MDMPIEYMTAQTAWKKGFIFQTLDTDHSFYFLVAPCSVDGKGSHGRAPSVEIRGESC